MKTLILILISFLLVKTTQGQKSNDGLVVKLDGYLINLDGDFIFQPCEDSTLNIWQALDRRSFSIWCNQIHDNYCDAVQQCGDSLEVAYKFVTDSSYNNAKFTYFYCTIETAIFFIGNNPNDFKVYGQAQYQVIHDGKSYPLNGLYIREILRKIIPKKLKDIKIMYNYYKDGKLLIPKWLDEEVNQQTSK